MESCKCDFFFVVYVSAFASVEACSENRLYESGLGQSVSPVSLCKRSMRRRLQGRARKMDPVRPWELTSLGMCVVCGMVGKVRWTNITRQGRDKAR